jgi:hypothetical protein
MHAIRQWIAASAVITVVAVGGGALSGCASPGAGTGSPRALGRGGASGRAASPPGAAERAGGLSVSSLPGIGPPVLASVPAGGVTGRPSASRAPTPVSRRPAREPGQGASRPAGGAAVPASPAVPRTAAGSRPVTAGPGWQGGGSPPLGPGACTRPAFSTSAQQGGWGSYGYYLSNDMWNAGSYSVRQTLYGCSAYNWYVTATMNNDSGDNVVKTYPNVHKDFGPGASVSGFHAISSSFAQVTDPAGIYEYAYDIWLNGLATGNSTEVMIWTYNHGQIPAGSQVAAAAIGGQDFIVWKRGSYIAFVARRNVNYGTLNLLQFFNWIIGKGWMAAAAALTQVDYGVELVSTGGRPETFAFSDFSVSASLPAPRRRRRGPQGGPRSAFWPAPVIRPGRAGFP